MTLHLLTVILLTFLVISALAIARMRELFPMVMLTGLYSLCSACLFMVLDAVDVAMTEAAVGAGVTTVLMLAALALTGGREKPAARKRTLMALGVTLATGAALVYATLDMPYFAAAATPVQQHPITAHYLYTMPVEIGVPNVVSAVLAGYRGYDTLGETTVIFTAAIAVLMLLGTRQRKAMRPVNDNSILRVVAQLLAPVILLFALYVQFHGDYGPGGGFQAGVLFAAAILLFGLVCGLDAAHAIMRPNLIRIMAAAGVLVYGGTGVATMLLGGQYLDYDVLAHDSVQGQHLGIMLVEFGVGLTVTATMVGLFAVFAARGSWRG